ncbi:hypothetical protein PTSG_12524 [Salpingoeca rosetta]|uniref:Uncharacterized protein n=1 Tax=Salpingoeca rosetta (strain ATCC 50818 / BSB-021) TaxID=946362 RepID=F2UDS6_SALR5|nr:uncharacterized protein PTSG_12524 [Salpingoeca rosetta]EGD74776.1 hypothetical protein PTSG_12524 [Salpingoeca rosetta]|eukprot:XP_004992421.1 hypothetical protein PTSG_12524 [Salpingoeca rosetta]
MMSVFMDAPTPARVSTPTTALLSGVSAPTTPTTTATAPITAPTTTTATAPAPTTTATAPAPTAPTTTPTRTTAPASKQRSMTTRVAAKRTRHALRWWRAVTAASALIVLALVVISNGDKNHNGVRAFPVDGSSTSAPPPTTTALQFTTTAPEDAQALELQPLPLVVNDIVEDSPTLAFSTCRGSTLAVRLEATYDTISSARVELRVDGTNTRVWDATRSIDEEFFSVDFEFVTPQSASGEGVFPLQWRCGLTVVTQNRTVPLSISITADSASEDCTCPKLHPDALNNATTAHDVQRIDGTQQQALVACGDHGRWFRLPQCQTAGDLVTIRAAESEPNTDAIIDVFALIGTEQVGRGEGTLSVNMSRPTQQGLLVFVRNRLKFNDMLFDLTVDATCAPVASDKQPTPTTLTNSADDSDDDAASSDTVTQAKIAVVAGVGSLAGLSIICAFFMCCCNSPPRCCYRLCGWRGLRRRRTSGMLHDSDSDSDRGGLCCMCCGSLRNIDHGSDNDDDDDDDIDLYGERGAQRRRGGRRRRRQSRRERDVQRRNRRRRTRGGNGDDDHDDDHDESDVTDGSSSDLDEDEREHARRERRRRRRRQSRHRRNHNDDDDDDDDDDDGDDGDGDDGDGDGDGSRSNAEGDEVDVDGIDDDGDIEDDDARGRKHGRDKVQKRHGKGGKTKIQSKQRAGKTKPTMKAVKDQDVVGSTASTSPSEDDDDDAADLADGGSGIRGGKTGKHTKAAGKTDHRSSREHRGRTHRGDRKAHTRTPHSVGSDGGSGSAVGDTRRGRGGSGCSSTAVSVGGSTARDERGGGRGGRGKHRPTTTAAAVVVEAQRRMSRRSFEDVAASLKA